MPSLESSRVRITDVRVSNFRSIRNIQVQLDELTVLVGANNAGKTSFLDALYAAIGSGRKLLGQNDIHLEPGEALPPQDRKSVIDVKLRPVETDGTIGETFPAGSYWTSLWGLGIVQHDIAQDLQEFHEFMGLRVTLSWSYLRGEYVLERQFLKEWNPFEDWLSATVQETKVSAAQIEPIALHYIDAKRDFDDDLRNQGSFWRRLTDDLGLSDVEIRNVEKTLTELNQQIVDNSEVLKHLKIHLGDMQSVVAADSAEIDISPVAPHLRDLSKGVNVSFSTQGGQTFPLTRHGMGTRSLASLLVFRAYAIWRSNRAANGNTPIHSLLALEEPEAHLHPQAQRSIFAQVKSIPGQRIVSTHSPYLASQAHIKELRLFSKHGGNTTVSQLDLLKLEDDDIRKIQDTVIESRGDLLFARAVVFFEGQTEEQALPVWAKKYWDADVHELGFSFVRVNGTDYYPFILLAEELGIPWYVFADGESRPLQYLAKAVRRLGRADLESCSNIVYHTDGRNFEMQLLEEQYLPEIEETFDRVHSTTSYLDQYIRKMEGQKGKRDILRTYSVPGGRTMAALDALGEHKTIMAKPLATTISNHPEPERRFPSKVEELFALISDAHSLTKSEQL